MILFALEEISYNRRHVLAVRSATVRSRLLIEAAAGWLAAGGDGELGEEDVNDDR